MPERPQFEDGIDTGSNLAFEARFWSFQRLAWGLLACFVAVGLMGGFGRGFFSAAMVPFSNGGDIEFEKLLRYKTPTSYTLNVKRLASGPMATDEVHVNISSGLLKKLNLKISESTPAATKVEAYAGGVVLAFKPGLGAETLQIKLTFEPRTIGPVRGQLGLSGNAPIEIKHFVYP